MYKRSQPEAEAHALIGTRKVPYRKAGAGTKKLSFRQVTINTISVK